MNVLLLQPYKLNDSPVGGSSYPLGVGYVAAGLMKADNKVSLLDCYMENPDNISSINGAKLYRIGLSDQDIVDSVTRLKPDIVGISIPFSKQIKAAMQVSFLLKMLNDKMIIVAGGAHVSAAPESLNHSAFDYLVAGEGEESFPRLVNALNGNLHDLESIPGVYYRNPKGDFTNKEPCRLIMNLDDIPFPAYDLMPFKKIWARRIPYVNIIATRGCNNNCCFCSIHAVMGRKIRRRSIDNVMEEIDILVNNYGVREIFFEDDNLTADLTWAKKLFESLCHKSYNIELGFRNGIRADKVDKELLSLMLRAGCARICFAPESGSQGVLDNIIDKRLRLSDVENAVTTARKVGLNVSCFFVIGIPGETKEDIQKTIRFAEELKRLGCDNIEINCAIPYPGTRLHRQCLEKKLINDEIDWSTVNTAESIINTEEFSGHEVTRIRFEAEKRLKETKAEKYRRSLQNFKATPGIYCKRIFRKVFV